MVKEQGYFSLMNQKSLRENRFFELDYPVKSIHLRDLICFI